MNEEKLLADFKSTSKEDWIAAIEKELKGKPFESLVKPNEDGFSVKPFYDRSDLPEVLQPTHEHADWTSVQELHLTKDSTELIRKIETDLKQGLDAFSLYIPAGFSPKDLPKSLPTELIHSWVFWEMTPEWQEWLKDKPAEAYVSFDEPTLAAILKTKDIRSDIVSPTESNEFKQNPLILSHLYAEAGCNLVDQSAFLLLAIAIETLKGIHPPRHFGATIGVGRRLIPEIARLRALNRIWKRPEVISSLTQGIPFTLHARSVGWTLTPEFPYNNLVRLTLQGTAAVLGGANSVSLLPYDYGLAAGFSDHARRMSINIHHLMRHESHLNRMIDPLAGAYAIEHLTNEYEARIMERYYEGFVEFAESPTGYIRWLKRQIEFGNASTVSRISSGDTRLVEVNHLRAREPENKPEWAENPFLDANADNFLICPRTVYDLIQQDAV